MESPRYTFIWWGDGYFVYDGDKYIGKDDQVDAIDLLVDAGAARKIDYEDAGDEEYGVENYPSLAEFFKEYGERESYE
jgi:hypothetical protein